MILIQRGPEPPALAAVRAEKLADLKAMKAAGKTPTSDDIEGYREPSAHALREAQHKKCCYCEHKITLAYHHVEHFRPKGRAIREPGCTETTGYWWLAYTWENLLFACPSCNSSAKKDLFPLEHGSKALAEHELPPGTELPLLLDPAGPRNPVCEIIFKFEQAAKGRNVSHWYARARDGSKYGAKTIHVLKLNCSDLLGLRDDYFERHLQPKIEEIEEALKIGQTENVIKAYKKALELLKPRHEYVGLAYDAFRYFIENKRLLAAINVGWPEPENVGI